MKTKAKDLRNKSTKELIEMKRQFEFHLMKAYSPKGKDSKGYNIKQEKRNIARINTILKERKNEN